MRTLRLRLVIGTALLLWGILYLSTGQRATRLDPFVKNTLSALHVQKDGAGEPVMEGLLERLKDAEKAAKESANKKGEKILVGLGGEGSVGKMEHGEEAEGMGKKGAGKKEEVKVGRVRKEKEKGEARKDGEVEAAMAMDGEKSTEIDEDEKATKLDGKNKAIEAREEINRIIKQRPVVIFSKTFCPYSKRAKTLLQSEYQITPEPYVVELDEHPLGHFIQDELAELTGRHTVPNVLVNGVSIGGADELQTMHEEGRLKGVMQKYGSRYVEVVQKGLQKGESKR